MYMWARVRARAGARDVRSEIPSIAILTKPIPKSFLDKIAFCLMV